MASDTIGELNAATVRRRLPRPLRAHVFLSVAALGILAGGGLRFIPTGTAATPGSSGGQGAVATACAAK